MSDEIAAHECPTPGDSSGAEQQATEPITVVLATVVPEEAASSTPSLPDSDGALGTMANRGQPSVHRRCASLWPWLLLLPTFLVVNLLAVPRILDAILATQDPETMMLPLWGIANLFLSETAFVVMGTLVASRCTPTRALIAQGFAVVLAGTLLAGTWSSELGLGLTQFVGDWHVLLLVPGVFLALFLPFLVLKVVFGFRALICGALAEPNVATRQFGIGQLFLGTYVIGAALALATVGLSSNEDFEPSQAAFFVVMVLYYVLQWGLFSLLPAIWCSLVARRVTLASLAVCLYFSALEASAPTVKFAIVTNNWSYWVKSLARSECLAVEKFILLCGSLFLLRAAGYSLRRLEPDQAAGRDENAAVTGRSRIATGDPRTAARVRRRQLLFWFGSSVALLTLLWCLQRPNFDESGPPADYVPDDDQAQVWSAAPDQVQRVLRRYWATEGTAARGRRFEQAALAVNVWQIQQYRTFTIDSDELLAFLGPPDLVLSDPAATTYAYRYQRSDEPWVVLVQIQPNTNRVLIMGYNVAPEEGFSGWSTWSEAGRQPAP